MSQAPLPDPPFESSARTDGEVTTVTVSGELDMATVDRLDETVERASVGNGSLLIVDLSAVTFMDSTGLSGLLRLRERARRLSVVPSPAVRRVIELVALERELRLADSVDEARTELDA